MLALLLSFATPLLTSLLTYLAAYKGIKSLFGSYAAGFLGEETSTFALLAAGIFIFTVGLPLLSSAGVRTPSIIVLFGAIFTGAAFFTTNKSVTLQRMLDVDHKAEVALKSREKNSTELLDGINVNDPLSHRLHNVIRKGSYGSSNDTKLIRWLTVLIKNANKSAINREYRHDTPIALAIKLGHEQAVKSLLDSGKVDLLKTCKPYGNDLFIIGRLGFSYTPLSIALHEGNPAIIRMVASATKKDKKAKHLIDLSVIESLQNHGICYDDL